MADDDAAWLEIRSLMNAKTDAQFTRLRDDFRAGIPDRITVDQVDASRFLALMAELGGETLVGQASTLPEGLFADVE